MVSARGRSSIRDIGRSISIYLSIRPLAHAHALHDFSPAVYLSPSCPNFHPHLHLQTLTPSLLFPPTAPQSNTPPQPSPPPPPPPLQASTKQKTPMKTALPFRPAPQIRRSSCPRGWPSRSLSGHPHIHRRRHHHHLHSRLRHGRYCRRCHRRRQGERWQEEKKEEVSTVCEILCGGCERRG